MRKLYLLVNNEGALHTWWELDKPDRKSEDLGGARTLRSLGHLSLLGFVINGSYKPEEVHTLGDSHKPEEEYTLKDYAIAVVDEQGKILSCIARGVNHRCIPVDVAIFPLQDLLALKEEYMSRPAAEETINDPTNPKHYWRYRMCSSAFSCFVVVYLFCIVSGLLLYS
ncbi:hypothetical protein LguiB_020457 [Lonicera macranthoides]